MSFSNNMTDLINKIEQRLGTAPLTLPDHLKKDKWPEKVIIPMTLVTWSRYYPNRVRYHIDCTSPRKNGWYILDEDLFEGVKILGVTNIDWNNLNGGMYNRNSAYSDPYYGYDMSAMSIVNTIGGTNISSLFNNGVFPTFENPNRFRLETVGGHPLTGIDSYDVFVLVQHTSNLLTISPTMMETFEDLAQSDVAIYLYNELKYFDNLDTVFANSTIKIEDLAEKANKRDDVLSFIKENYVSASNKNQPIMLCI